MYAPKRVYTLTMCGQSGRVAAEGDASRPSSRRGERGADGVPGDGGKVPFGHSAGATRAYRYGADLLVGEAAVLAAAARRNRVLAALSTLELAVEQAAAREGRELVRVEAQHATAACAECGSVEVWDHRQLRHRCSACGAEWDQDHNAARILLRRALATL